MNIPKLKSAIEENDLNYVRDAIDELQGDLLEILQRPILDDLPVVNYICKHKNTEPDILKVFLDSGGDVSQPSEEGTPIQLACRHGNADVIPLLLDYGAKLDTPEIPVYAENSPFYIASVCGHEDVVRTLYNYEPSMSQLSQNPLELVKDVRVRSCLLYAACLGGNLSIIRQYWYSPDISINDPPYYTTSNISMDKTPFYAACSENHFEVVKYLYKHLEAELNQMICEQFPDIVCSLLPTCVTECEENEEENSEQEDAPRYSADFTRKDLGGFHGDWIQPYTDTLVYLDIGHNTIRRLPNMVPWGLPNLKSFFACHNKLTQFSADPLGAVMCVRLNEVNISNNVIDRVCDELFHLPNLTNLNVSHNRLPYLVKTHQKLVDWRNFTKDVEKSEWRCLHLSILNVSHNKLEMFPPDIKMCRELIDLDVSYNNLTSFQSPWECKLARLDLSHNELERFPPSVEQFWCGTLRTLKLNDNKLEEINESIVKLCVLQNLDMSNNNIFELPKPELWDCKQLGTLRLNNNKLGYLASNIQEVPSSHMPKIFKRLSTSVCETASTHIQFPAFLSNSLTDLYLSNNGLSFVPPSICNLMSLQVVDLSKNPSIKTLPCELGKLIQCSSLNLDGCGVPDMYQTISSSDGVEKQLQKTREIIQTLRDELRQCQKYFKMKLVILGKKDKGKTTLASLLGCKIPDDNQNVGLRRMETQIHPKKLSSHLNVFSKRNTSNPVLMLSVWDLAGDEAYAATHHCFFTSNSLYLLVWDVCSLLKEMDKVGKWLYSIEARNPNSKVILVGTFLDKLTGSNRNSEVTRIKQEILQRYGNTSEKYGGLCSILDQDNIIFVSCTNNKEGIGELKKNLCKAAMNIKMIGSRVRTTGQAFLGRSIPHSYVLLEKEIHKHLQNRLENERPPFLLQNEFEDVIIKIPGCDIDVSSDMNDVVKFLVESGSILHFNDQLKGLNNLYFLDPSWLCDVLSKVLVDPSGSRAAKGGKIALSKVLEMYQNDDKFPNDLVPQLVQLLERFEIALTIEGGKKLFIPSWLSSYPAMDLNFQNQEGKKVCRLYQLAFTPTGLWSRLLSRIMGRIELLSNDWVLRQSSKTVISHTQIHRTLLRRSSSQGLTLKNKDMIYWEDGMCLRHSRGYFILESIVANGNSASGIVITVQSMDSEYSVLGMIVDAIDDLLNDHYPGLMDFDFMGQPRIQRFAVCPVCYNLINRELPENLDHFTVEHCARLLLTSDTIVCKTGLRIDLCDLVPELLFRELPSKFLLDYKTMDIDKSNASFLGRGVAGSVFKGHYGPIDVAVKFYNGAPNMKTGSNFVSRDSNYFSGDNNLQAEQEETEAGSTDEDTDDYINAGRSMSVDTEEANSIKAWKAFMEMRQEVDVTSKLQHPSIIAFLGICVRPNLLMCLELAPFGSLRNVLDSEIEGREPFNKYRDKNKIFNSVFNKDLTYRFVFQIAKGLEYLHKNYIIYRDLKSDNILVISLKLDVPVNVKLSDYGISKFNTSGGIVGMVGTPGYQAPEIIEGLAYDEKVDIFSFAMVIYELLSGERPYCEYRNLAQISRAMKNESKRPSLNDTNIDSRFPMLENLMYDCWQLDASLRPAASDIVSGERMRSVQFICQHKVFTTPDLIKHEDIDCVAKVMGTEEVGQRSQLWLWEGSDKARCCHVIDATLCRYHVYNEIFPGHTVSCMTKVDKEVWVGTENEEIEVFGRSGIGNLSINRRLDKLGAVPTCILYLDQSSQGSHKVYVSLHNGRLRIYVPKGKTIGVSKNQDEWRLHKTLQISKTEASCMVHVPEVSELWVGCVDQIAVVSDNTEMVEQRIILKHDNIKILTFNMREVKIQSLTYCGGQVWCLIADSACILEYDAETRFMTHIFQCDEISPLGMIVSQYVSELSVEAARNSDYETPRGSYDSDEYSEITSDELESWINESMTKHDNVFRPPTDFPQNSSTFPRGPVCNRNPRRLVSYPETAPNVLPRSPISSSSMSPPLIPPRPAKHHTTDTKSRTLPPALPSHSCYKAITVNTINVVGDVLWVGRSCGDILVIETKSDNASNCSHGLVISCLLSKGEGDKGDSEVEKLISIGDSLVVSLVKESSKSTKIIAWEAYTCQKIQDIESYWSLKDKDKNQEKPKTIMRHT